MNDNMTAQLLIKLMELKAELDTADKQLTFKVTASNDLLVQAYPFFHGYICYTSLNKVTEETYNYVVNAIYADFVH